MSILDILSSAKYVSGQKIAKELGLSRAAVHKQVLKLKNLGYEIKSKKNLGYFLVSKPGLLTAEEIKHLLPRDFKFCKTIIYRNEVSSTQLVAKKLAEQGMDEGTLVICEKQTSAYGRLQRHWSAPDGGVWFSLILKPRLLPEKVPQITLAMSISIARVLENSLGIKPFIKWPNDIVVNDKKICGIITEMSSEVGNVNWVVAGVGLNANNVTPKNLKNIAVSLKGILQKEVNRSELLADILINYLEAYEILCAKGFLSLKDEYNKYAYLTGKAVKVKTPNAIISGIALKVDQEGYLMVKTSNGVFKVLSGDATVLK
ncbi:MAG: biotin--[acetyl-CoA-carboxylase] ligase [Elusimicrobia bacterium]|nr:biotin--[acetyl-CoA-carboxylase] ligase [Candidatus Liberimonas magnetica]